MKSVRLLAVVCAWLLWPPLGGAQEKACQVAAEALQAASRIRGLEVIKPVPCVLQNREEVKRHLEEVIERDLPAGRLEYEEAAFQAIGLIPEDFGYRQGICLLYTSPSPRGS